MLLTIATTPPLALCAGCAAFLIIIGLWYAYNDRLIRYAKKLFARVKNLLPKKQQPWQGRTPAEAYSKILDYIILAQTGNEVEAIHPMLNDFSMAFSGRIPDLEIIHYVNDLVCEMENRKSELVLDKIRRYSLSSVG